jgi:glutamate N-acetyltransferase/amino-acid N-acetyltransferase
MANGQSGAKIINADHAAVFHSVLDEVLIEISRQLVRDGEGVTKLVDIVVKGAATDDDAYRIADTVAHSPLLKTAFFGQDANWGRIFMAVGRAGVDINPDTIDVFFDDVMMVKDSFGRGEQAEKEATEVLKKPEFNLTIDLKMGHGHASMLTCDFSVDYVKINADYRS